MEVAVLKKSVKGNQHILRMQQEVVRQQQVVDMQISVVNTSLELVKNPSAEPDSSKEEVTYRPIATMQLEFSWIPGSKKKRKSAKLTKSSDLRDLEPPSKLPTQKSPLFKHRRRYSFEPNEAFTEQVKELRSTGGYHHNYNYSSDERRFPSRHVSPPRHPPLEYYYPNCDPVSDDEDFSEPEPLFFENRRVVECISETSRFTEINNALYTEDDSHCTVKRIKMLFTVNNSICWAQLTNNLASANR